MKANLTKSFEVSQDTDLVWEHLIDPQKIMYCVPGVAIDEKVGDNHYKGTVGMKFGPMGVKYDADIFYNEIDEENRKIIISGNGVESKGQGNAEMKMTIDITELDAGGVKMDALMDVVINGKIAQYGSRLIDTVSNQLFKQFVSNFKTKLEMAEAEQVPKVEPEEVSRGETREVSGGFLQRIWQWLKQLFK